MRKFGENWVFCAMFLLTSASFGFGRRLLGVENIPIAGWTNTEDRDLRGGEMDDHSLEVFSGTLFENFVQKSNILYLQFRLIKNE